MPVKPHQIVESRRRELSVSDEDAEKIMDAIMVGHQIHQRGRGKEACVTAFTHPIENCPAWAVEVWARNKWTRVFFDESEAETYYGNEIDRLSI